MPLVDQVSAEMKAAMKARDKVRLGALRGMRASFIEAMKADGSDTLADEACVTILRRLAKQRRESIEAYANGGRPELAEEERGELAVIEEFLPQLADAATTKGWVEAAIAESGASGMGDMGKVMGLLMRDHKGQLDGKLANGIVRKLLA